MLSVTSSESQYTCSESVLTPAPGTTRPSRGVIKCDGCATVTTGLSHQPLPPVPELGRSGAQGRGRQFRLLDD
eukprot:8364282-Pyramimonas_sp.AAC.2